MIQKHWHWVCHFCGSVQWGHVQWGQVLHITLMLPIRWHVANGTWSVNSNVLTTNPISGTAYNLTTNDTAGTLVKGAEVYKTDQGDEFTVTKIVEELSCLVPAK